MNKEKFGIGIDENDSVGGSAVDSMAESVKNLLHGIRNSVGGLIRNVVFATQLSAAALGVIGCDKSYSRPEPDDTTQCVRTNPKDALDPPQCDSTIPAEVAVSASGMTIALTTTEPLTISQLVVTVEGICSDIEVIIEDISEDRISWIASRVASDKFDLATFEPIGPSTAIAQPIEVPKETGTIRLYVLNGGRGDEWFATNPALDWFAQDKLGRAVELPDEEIGLHLTTMVSIFVDGVSGVDRPVTQIAKGSCVTLSWTIQDATECWATWLNKNGNEPDNAQLLAGSEDVCPTEYSKYVLKCRGPGGSVGQVVFVSPQ